MKKLFFLKSYFILLILSILFLATSYINSMKRISRGSIEIPSSLESLSSSLESYNGISFDRSFGSSLDNSMTNFGNLSLINYKRNSLLNSSEEVNNSNNSKKLKNTKIYTEAEYAAFDNDLTRVIQLVNQGIAIDVNKKEKGDSGWSMLHIAAIHANFELAKYLIKNGADVHARSCYGDTPLHFVIFKEGKKAIKIAQLFLENKADINAQNNYGDTPIHLAAENANLNLIKLFIECGADITTKNRDNKTILELSLEIEKHGHDYTCSRYIQYFQTKTGGLSILQLAVIASDIKMISHFIATGENINYKDKNRNRPLHFACKSSKKNCLRIAQLLMKNGSYINAINNEGETALHIAAKTGHKYLTEFFAEKGANVFLKNKDGKRAVELATNDECRNYLKQIKIVHGKLLSFLSEICNFQKKYDIKNKTTDQMCKIKINIGTNKTYTLNDLLLYNAKKVKELILDKNLIQKKQMIPFFLEYAIFIILTCKLHKKYPILFSSSFIKNIVKNLSLKTFLLKSPNFMKIIFAQYDIVDSNGFYPYQKIAYYPSILPLILSNHNELYKEKDSLKKIILGDELKYSEKIIPIFKFLKKSVQFARKKKLKKYLHRFQVFRDLERKFYSINKIALVTNKKSKNSRQLTHDILEYSCYY